MSRIQACMQSHIGFIKQPFKVIKDLKTGLRAATFK